ncbi:MAG: dockerin type I domain-containing protein [Pirellulales bacterium]
MVSSHPLDTLLIINALNLNGPKPVSGIILPTDRPFQIDVNGDGVISPLDALIVINHLNRFGPSQGEGGGGEGGEGEGGTDQGLSGSAGQTFWAIQPPLQSHDAIDENEGSISRRRRITWLARS